MNAGDVDEAVVKGEKEPNTHGRYQTNMSLQPQQVSHTPSAGTGQITTPPETTNVAGTHSRNYQACIPCRKRKVKCNLGPVDDPHDPPCDRCMRERKDCYFSATRRKRKGAESPPDDVDSDEFDASSMIQHSRKRAASENRGFHPFTSTAGPYGNDPRRVFSSGSEDSSQSPLTPGGGFGQPAPLRRPGQRLTVSDDEDQMLTNTTAALLQSKEIYNGQDALSVLAQLAEHNGTQAKKRRTVSSSDLPRPQYLGDGRSQTHETRRRRLVSGKAESISPLESRFEGMPGLKEALEAWNKLRFVKAGWFTAHEGIAYVDYFYRYLLPLTPITLPDFQMPATHAHLLQNEPMLTTTLLAIASRYMSLNGFGRSTRAFAIHDKLWKDLRSMIESMNWNFSNSSGSAFSMLGANVPMDLRGLRTLGSIESLLLLTEWHPRALHFPADTDHDGSMLVQEEPPPSAGQGPSAQATDIGRWLEPCWKSDQFCWSLLGNALTLGHELGVLSPSENQDHASQQRLDNIRRLLYIYMTQTSGRLSRPSMISEEPWATLFANDSITLAISSMDLAGTSYDTASGDATSKGVVESVNLYFWHKIAHLFHLGNAELFQSREVTSTIIATGKYTGILDHLANKHQEWRKELDKCKIVPTYMRYILIIEYEYMRVYGNCLALQAVVDRCAKMGPKTKDNFIDATVLSKCYDGDRKYIKSIVTSSQNLLKCLIEGLLPDDYLKHAPVRTYFRIISVSMVLLKTFALGATQDDIAFSLGLLDQAVQALHSCIVDDIHVGSRFADLLSILAQRVRSRMVRVSRRGQSSAPGNSSSPTPPPPERSSHGRSSYARRSRSSSISERRGTINPSPLANTWQPADDQPQPPNQQQWMTNQNLSQVSGQSYGDVSDAFGRQVHDYAQHDQFSFMATGSYGQQTWADPLRGVSPSLPYDPHNPVTPNIMPPPMMDFSYSNQQQAAPPYYNDTAGSQQQSLPSELGDPYNTLGVYGNQETWCALPIDPLLGNSPGNVTHSGFGPNIGGQDMLDVLLRDGVYGDNAGTR